MTPNRLSETDSDGQAIMNEASTDVPTVDISSFIGQAKTPILDVRSPGEFDRGHIPSACSVPLFSDAQRAEIGTLYKQVSQEAAVRRGTEIATAQSTQLLEAVRRAVPGGGEFVMHCWRGGMRSLGFARLCLEHGFKPRLLVGGYKAYRQFARASFSKPIRLLVITGSTGCGKTDLIKQLAVAGQQTLDLEGLACHKGSAFGGIGQPEQPTVEHFENLLFTVCRGLDLGKPIWVEDESRAIGRVSLPEPFWEQLSDAPSVVIQTDIDARVERLVAEYGGLPRDDLVAAMVRLQKRLGGLRLQAATAFVDEGRIADAVRLILEYYDKAYTRARVGRRGPEINTVQLTVPASAAEIQQLCDFAASIGDSD